MSDLQRSFAKAKLASLPATLPDTFDTFDTFDEREETDAFTEIPEPQFDDSSSASSASSTGTITPAASHNLFARPSG